jgi:glutamine amidotransferase
MTTVAILDYGSGNLHSVAKAVAATGVEALLSADFDDCVAADGLVVPGVGAFAACMRALREVEAEGILRERLERQAPVLGICVGHQVFFENGVEHGEFAEGLSLFAGTVERLRADVLPHMGWNTVAAPEGSQMFAGVADERFYFVHSYAAREVAEPTAFQPEPRFDPLGTGMLDSFDSGGAPLGFFRASLSGGESVGFYQTARPNPGASLADARVAWTEHGGDRFISAVELGPLWSTQFHPEKSGEAGARLLRNWVETLHG